MTLCHSANVGCCDSASDWAVKTRDSVPPVAYFIASGTDSERNFCEGPCPVAQLQDDFRPPTSLSPACLLKAPPEPEMLESTPHLNLPFEVKM
jgi:hypothetical protein